MPLSSKDLNTLLQDALKAAQDAGQLISSYGARIPKTQTKVAGDSLASQVLTEVDLLSEKFVITSYSIHYTKLYDPETDSLINLLTIPSKSGNNASPLATIRSFFNLTPLTGSYISYTKPIGALTFSNLIVITSYSIHYTKLYDGFQDK